MLTGVDKWVGLIKFKIGEDGEAEGAEGAFQGYDF